mmetsp:Transcript_90476/g.174154  ORF Transcript_90476/g.174154 Transcript_90476/m.174154 type:complete len:212 (+) Transcript_90476:519-1154(+)
MLCGEIGGVIFLRTLRLWSPVAVPPKALGSAIDCSDAHLNRLQMLDPTKVENIGASGRCFARLNSFMAYMSRTRAPKLVITLCAYSKSPRGRKASGFASRSHIRWHISTHVKPMTDGKLASMAVVQAHIIPTEHADGCCTRRLKSAPKMFTTLMSAKKVAIVWRTVAKLWRPVVPSSVNSNGLIQPATIILEEKPWTTSARPSRRIHVSRR